jgi:lysophospholipase
VISCFPVIIKHYFSSQDLRKDTGSMNHLEKFFPPDAWQEGSFTNRHGKKIRTGHAAPEGACKGTVVMTTGYADFTDAYFETIRNYLDRGYAVWMMDWAGHGGSDKVIAGKSGKPGQRPAILDDHIEDLEQFRKTIVQPVEGAPVFLSTHSMGGQVALRYLEKNKTDFDAAVLATPFVDMNTPPLKKAFLQRAFAAAVALGFGDVAMKNGRRRAVHKIVTARRDRKDQNPIRMRLHKTLMFMPRDLKAEDPTVAYIESMYRSAAQLNAKGVLEKIETPVLFGIGGRDNMVDNNAIRAASKKMPNGKLCEIDDASHAFWLERDDLQKTWWQAIDGFFAAAHTAFDQKHNPANDNAAAQVLRKPKTPQAKGP